MKAPLSLLFGLVTALYLTTAPTLLTAAEGLNPGNVGANDQPTAAPQKPPRAKTSTAWSMRTKVAIAACGTTVAILGIVAGAFASKYYTDLEFRAKLRLLYAGWLMLIAQWKKEPLTREVVSRIIIKSKLPPTETLIQGLMAFQGKAGILTECLPVSFYVNGDVSSVGPVTIPYHLQQKADDAALAGSVSFLVNHIQKALPVNENIKALFRGDETARRPTE